MKRLYVFLFLGLFAFAAGAIVMTVTSDQAQACGWEDDCGGGWEEPDDHWDDGWDDDCGCHDDNGGDIDVHVDVENKVKLDVDLELDVDVENNVDVVNNNENNNTNNNVNNNTNNNNVTVIVDGGGEGGGDVNINNSSNANAAAEAIANSAATSAATAASRAGGRLNTSNLRNSVFGEERRGAGGTIVNAARAPITIGPLRVVVKEERVKSRAVRGVCLDAKGLEEAAYLAVSSNQIDIATGSGELMYCQMGDALVATIGEVPDGGGQPNYTHGEVIECLDGQSLHYGNEGRLACGPSSNAYFTGSDRRIHVRYAEVFLNRKSSGYTSDTTAFRGATTYNGGVGY